jgi:hypothetical protein
VKRVPVHCRIDRLEEAEHFRNDGIPHYIPRRFAAQQKARSSGEERAVRKEIGRSIAGAPDFALAQITKKSW